MIKKALRYIGIGVLLGIGMLLVNSVANVTYMGMLRDEQTQRVDEFKEMLDMLFVAGDQNIFNTLEGYDPAATLTLSLQGFARKDDQIIATGKISNAGPDEWNLLAVELEVFSDGRRLIAECQEVLPKLGPMEWEYVALECPLLDEFKGSDKSFEQVHFEIKKRYQGRKHVNPSNTFDEQA